MEYFDLLDEAGEFTGEKKLREHVHRDGNRHRSVHVWIVNSNQELLLQKRSASKQSYPNMWSTSVAGHVSAGETPVEAVQKEMQEEIGVAVAEEDIHHIGTVMIEEEGMQNNERFFNNEFIDIFVIFRDLDIERLILQEEELSGVKWMPFREYERIAKTGGNDTMVISQNVYPILCKYLHKKFG